MVIDSETLQRFRNAIRDEKATFIFVPSVALKEKLIKQDDPVLNELPIGMAELLISCPLGSGLATDVDMVLKYLEGTLDAKNAHLLAMGEIRVVGIGDMKIKTQQIPQQNGGIIQL